MLSEEQCCGPHTINLEFLMCMVLYFGKEKMNDKKYKNE